MTRKYRPRWGDLEGLLFLAMTVVWAVYLTR